MPTGGVFAGFLPLPFGIAPTLRRNPALGGVSSISMSFKDRSYLLRE